MTIEELIAKWHAQGVAEKDILKRALLAEKLKASMAQVTKERIDNEQ